MFFIALTISTITLPRFAYSQAPDFTLPTIDGKTVSLSQFKGQVVYVDFWATWCPPCRRSFPWMEKMYQKYQTHGFQIIAISLDGKQEIVDRFLAKINPTFIVARDKKSQVASEYKVQAMPSSYLIDRNGEIYYEHRGFNENDKNKMEEKFRNLLLN